MERNKIYKGNTLDVLKTFPDNSIDCIVTSPPYWGPRKYGTEEDPPIWYTRDHQRECEHDWYKERTDGISGGTKSEKVQIKGKDNFQKVPPSYQYICKKCHVMKVELGRERSYKDYIYHIMLIVDECRRVLKETGTFWLNIGDTYHKKGEQRKSLVGVPQRIMIEMIDKGWICRNDNIWYKPDCIDQTTTLYSKTQTGVGVRTLKDLVRLDPSTVELWDGKKWNRVIEWLHNNNPQNTIEITLRNGEKIRCTGNHKFVIDSNQISASELKVGDILDNCYFPNQYKTVDYLPDVLIGWFIGTYLADGSKQENHIDISSHVNEIDRLETCKELVKYYDGAIKTYTENNSMTIRIHSKILIEIVNKYISGSYARSKHLKPSVWKRNDRFLQSLLNGYLDGDGHWDTKNRRWRLNFTRNRFLADNLRTLCARLGYYMTLRESFASIRDKKYKSYNGQIKLKPDKKSFQIMEISDYKGGEYYDIVLENEPHLFSTASGLLVHNCMPHPVKDRFTPDLEHVYEFGAYFPFYSKNPNYYFNQLLVELKSKNVSERTFGGTKHEGYGPGTYSGRTYSSEGRIGKNRRTVWKIPTANLKEAHFAAYPEELPRLAIEAGCPRKICDVCGEPRSRFFVQGEKIVEEEYNGSAVKDYEGTGSQNPSDTKRRILNSMRKKYERWTDCGHDSYSRGTVLDPFMGSGTTALAALSMDVDFVGIEYFQKYIDIAMERIEKRFPTFKTREAIREL